MTTFARRVIEWQRRHGRHALPWQDTQDAYRIWLSEIMLQQTQVATVIPYYQRFLERFPTIVELAAADQSEIMEMWAGLGYYTRARNLHRCAQDIAAHWDGAFPPDAAAIATLPGIGRSTAAAIAAFARGERAAILDGNVRRVFARHFGIEGDLNSKKVQDVMWAHAEAELPVSAPNQQADDMRAYTQGLMDLGATLCTRGNSPHCGRCPVRATCIALREARQHELPSPRIRKAIPQRTTNMLWVRHQSRTLLERRPSPGIWGGLLSLPEFGEGDALDACRQLGVSVATVRQLPPFVHTFTHFRLTATPWLIDAGSLSLREDDALYSWLTETELTSAALPAPVRKLLVNVGSDSSKARA